MTHERETWNVKAELPAHTFKILVVEDDVGFEPLWQSIVKRALGEHARVEWATSEVEAEELILKAKDEGLPYALVITDIFLSGSRTGIDLWKKFFREMRGRIILTSGIEHTKFNRYFEKEAERPVYLQKPLVPHECIEIVYELLNRRMYA